MSLQDIVVLLDGSARDETKLAIALQLAKRNDAHLTGLCPLELLLPADMSFALGGYPDLWSLPEFAKQVESQAQARAATIETGFRELLRREGLNGGWDCETGPLIPAVTRRVQACDLLIIGQNDPDHPSPAVARTLLEDVLMTAGRPLLIVPYAGRFDTIGTNALVGWTPTRESARAVHDALSVFTPGAKVTVLSVEGANAGPDVDTVPTADIAEHLARHGLTVSSARTVASDGLSREMIMGGVTRDLLQHMTVPVLMSH